LLVGRLGDRHSVVHCLLFRIGRRRYIEKSLLPMQASHRTRPDGGRGMATVAPLSATYYWYYCTALLGTLPVLRARQSSFGAGARARATNLLWAAAFLGTGSLAFLGWW